MVRLLYLIVFVMISSPAAAFCFQGSDIKGALDYLVCLHNEQSDALNDHARLINQQAATIDDLRNDLDDAERRIRDLRIEVDSLGNLVRSMQQ